MGNISYTAHVSNKKSAITSKTKLAAVAKHNLRKYKSSDYSKDNIVIVYGTSNLIDDVKTVYHKEFDEALEEYNKKQTRPDRRIEDYFEHVAGKEQDMAVEIIIQIGDREFWRQFDDMKAYYQKQEKLVKIKKTIAKKLGKPTLTQYEEAYIEKWVIDFGYDLNIIEIALKRTTFKSNPTFEYFNNCDELRDFMLSHLDEPLSIIADFQGDMIEFDGYAVPKKGEVIHMDSYDADFTVGTVNEVTKTFVLTLGKFTDEACGVELPAYVREELIATLQGEW